MNASTATGSGRVVGARIGRAVAARIGRLVAARIGLLVAARIGLAVAAVVLLARCDTSFEVFGESDAHFSLFGVLDAASDTQWVRVESLQDSLLLDTKPLDAVVAMTHLASGRRVTWRDSLFRFIGGAAAYNVWTDEPIAPLATYRLAATRSDGATSVVTVTLPDTFPDPEINVYPFSLINLPISGNVCATTFEMVIRLERLAALQITYHVPTARGAVRRYSVSYVLKAERAANGSFEVIVPWVEDLRELAALDRDIGLDELLGLSAVDLLVASAGPDWPDNALDDETVALPGAVTHVENGFGFVGGVVSKRLSIPIGDYRDVSCFM